MAKNTSEEKPLTIVDVARILGISKSTVSAAFTGNGNISGKRRNDVRQAALKLGYQPNPYARRLTRGQSDNTVALFASTLDSGVATRKLQLLQSLLSQRGFMAPIYAFSSSLQTKPEEQTAIIHYLRELRPRAIACNVTELNQKSVDELRLYQEEGGVVAAYDYPLALDCDQVHFDREHNTYLAMRHLLELGHRNIGFALGLSHHSSDPRLQGLRRALKEFDVPLQEQWLHYTQKNRHELAGAGLADFFLGQNKRPTAMCIVNDYITAGFVACVQKHDIRVPRDLSVISHDNMPIAEIGAPISLTTISQPVDKIAKKVARQLLDRLDGTYAGPARQTKVRGALILRESTKVLLNTCHAKL